MRSVFGRIVTEIREGSAGGTFSVHGIPCTFGRGYQVGIGGTELRISRDLLLEDYYEIVAWLQYHGSMAVDNHFHIGLWFDEETGVYCLDISAYERDKHTAIAYAKGNGQKAIYDWENKVSITL